MSTRALKTFALTDVAPMPSKFGVRKAEKERKRSDSVVSLAHPGGGHHSNSGGSSNNAGNNNAGSGGGGAPLTASASAPQLGTMAITTGIENATTDGKPIADRNPETGERIIPESMKNIGGELGMMGHEKHNFVRGTHCYLHSTTVGVTGNVRLSQPMMEQKLSAWFNPALLTMVKSQSMSILNTVLQKLVAAVEKELLLIVQRTGRDLVSLNKKEVFDPDTNQARAVAELKGQVRRAFQQGTLLQMYSDILQEVLAEAAMTEAERERLAQTEFEQLLARKHTKLNLLGNKTPHSGARKGHDADNTPDSGSFIESQPTSPPKASVAQQWYKGPTRIIGNLEERTRAPAEIEAAQGYSSWQAKRMAKDTHTFKVAMSRAAGHMIKSNTLTNNIIPGGGIILDSRQRRESIPSRRRSSASMSATDALAAAAAAAGAGGDRSRRPSFVVGSNTMPLPTTDAVAPKTAADDPERRAVSPTADHRIIQRTLERVWSILEAPYQMRMDNLIEASSTVESALQLRDTVFKWDTAAQAVKHFFVIEALHKQARERVTGVPSDHEHHHHSPASTPVARAAAAVLREPIMMPPDTLVYLKEQGVLGDIPVPSPNEDGQQLDNYYFWLYRRMILFTYSAVQLFGRTNLRNISYMGRNVFSELRAAAQRAEVSLKS